MHHLLDANVLIALSVDTHVHHERVVRWVDGAGALTTSPVAEGAVVRYLLRAGLPLPLVTKILRAAHARAPFVPDDLSYADVDLGRLPGPRHATDSYLAALARSRPGCRLATLDEQLARTHPDVVDLLPG